MSSQQKRGFRLPWGPERASDADGMDGTPAATLDPASPDPTDGVDSDDLGEGPFDLAGASPTSTTDEAPASSEMPEDTAEAAMIDTQAQTQPTANGDDTVAEAPDGAQEDAPGGWPVVDRRSSPDHAADADGTAVLAPIHAVGDTNGARPARRENPLVAGLVKAMREAAVSSRDETLSRLNAEAETRVEAIKTRATTETADLRKRAEDDIAGIRDWSKAEIARVRQQTEDRIEGRRTELANETERHADSVERLVADVKSVVETFERDMDEFFKRLLAEDDPARLAALAEQAPDAPDFSGDGPAAIDLLGDIPDRLEAAASDELETVTDSLEAEAPEALDAAPDEVEAQASDEVEAAPSDGLEADAAAAAEVAAGEGLDMGESNEWPAAALAAAQRDEVEPDAVATDEGATRLLVSGLGSVAGISALKGALGQLAGVHGVSVSSGEQGAFVFAVSHDPGVDLATGIAGLPGFDARITEATDQGIVVVAHEPAA
jgi:hypothetical protein